MNLSELCIRRPVMTTLLMVAFVVFGIAGYRQLSIGALPRVDFPTIQVSASLPGASPETMASTVATPLERQFSAIPGVSSITSSSQLGSTQITLQFDLDRNIDAAAQDVQSALSVAQRRLPVEMTTPPSFRKVNPADQPILLIALTSTTLPLTTVNEYADSVIGQRISTLPGVAQVQIFGEQKKAVRVQVDPEAMASRGIALEDVQRVVAAATSSAPVGSLNGPRQQLTLQATGQPVDAGSYRSLIVAYRNGAPVRLSDVASIIDGVENNRLSSWYNGVRSITLAVQKQPDANTVAVVDAVKALMPQLRAQVPPSVSVEIFNDRSTSIRDSMDDVKFTLVLTMVLVVLVIYLFLRKAATTLIPAAALPISIVGTFAGMYMLGFSLNNISLMALTLAVGFVVDDAIVMLENIHRHVEEGMQPMAAALKGSREIGFTIVSMTVSLVAVFIPVLFMGGLVGRLFREFAVTISVAILVSGVVSLTLTPMLCSRFMKPQAAHKEGRISRAMERGFLAVQSAYGWTLRIVLRHRLLTLMAALASLAISAYAYQAIPKGFFPNEDTGLIAGITEGSQDISFEAMSALQSRAATIVAQDPDVRAVNSNVGSGGGGGAVNTGRLFIQLKDRAERQASAPEVIQRLRGKLGQIPGINVFMQAVQNINLGGRLSRGQYQYTLQSGDLAQLYDAAPRMEERLKQIPGIRDVSSDLQIKSPQLLMQIDRDRAQSLGINPDQIRSTLYSAYGARQVATIYTPSNSYAVILEVDPKFQEAPESIGKLYVRSSSGQLVPMETIATPTRTVGPLAINHQSQMPSVTLSFNLAQGVALGPVVEQIGALERDARLPAAVTSSFQGAAQFFQQSLAGQGLLLAAAVLVVYIILGCLYESFVHPITILSGLPAAGLGAILTLALFGMELSVIAMIGIVMLIGIVKKNAIMIVDFALQRQREGEADPAKAVYEACLMRFRPIMMTTMAAIMGTMPIAIGHGAGSELRQPLGIAVVGGLIVSQLLTLYITPVVFLYLERLSRRLGPRPKAAEDFPDGTAKALPGQD